MTRRVSALVHTFIVTFTLVDIYNQIVIYMLNQTQTSKQHRYSFNRTIDKLILSLKDVKVFSTDRIYPIVHHLNYFLIKTLFFRISTKSRNNYQNIFRPSHKILKDIDMCMNHSCWCTRSSLCEYTV